MIILGIETSCDETAAAVVRGIGDRVEVLSNAVSSQIEIHKKYGGVVPEVAAREHVLNIMPVVNQALEKAGVNPLNPPLQGGRVLNPPFEGGAGGLDAIAVTVGPGLVTSLLVGVETAKTLAYAWDVPTVAVNHIEGHIYANFIGRNSKSEILNSKQIQNPKSKIKNKIQFPALILTVSGGHTMLVLMKGHGKYKVLGETRDDAAGEAFDKAAQLLQLGYPGGPAIAKWAEKINPLKPPFKRGVRVVTLPRPMINSNDFDFSFSGLKTALLYAIQKDRDWKLRIPEYAAEFQAAAVEVLVHKTIKAALKYNCKNIMLSGGVAANLELRRQLEQAVKNKLSGANLSIPEFKYCTDNAAMIATAGYFRARRKKFTPWRKLKADCNLELK
ncbi:MAG: tRNA (adenosine(37)-N6)-threonylcarbamoyltransferase complex transferase subunit TsaD [bacterium]|nr:tRNA (adenosine(37)-N6)-threonylcarbamoyltransferase complex transferase subunit TsaD [bacterium]